MISRILIAIGAVFFSGFLYAQGNIAQGKPVFLLGDGFNGAPESIVDGWFLPLGTPWNSGTVWWSDGACKHNVTEPCTIEIDLQEHFSVHSLIFQGDSDQYWLEYWDDALPGWQPAWPVPARGPAVQTRPDLPWGDPPGHVLDPPIVTNRLRVVGVGEDFNYAVSEVQAYGERWDPCVAAGGTPIGSGCWSEEPEYQTHAAAGELCYRFKVSCDGFVHGGFGACVYPNGFFDFGMNAQTGDPPLPEDPPPGPEDPGCGIGGGHMLNNKVEHSCSLDGRGKVKLDVKQVGMVHCDKQK